MNIILSKKLAAQIVELDHVLIDLYDADEFDEMNSCHLRVRQILKEYEQFKICLGHWFDVGGDSWYEQAAELLANIRCLLRRIS